MIYFDNAATTVLAPEVADEMCKIINNYYGNPSSVHYLGRQSKVLIEESKRKISEILNASPSEIYFTASGTEAINIAINGAVNSLGVKNILTSSIEHHAVLHSLYNHKEKSSIELFKVKIDTKGKIILENLEDLLKTHKNVLVALMFANNEIGNLLQLKEVSELCRKYNALFLCDTVQAIGKYDIDLSNLGIDFASCSAHKFHGPKGVGFLYINKKHKISPLTFGGGQERNMRPGTENIYGIAGMAKALEISSENMSNNIDYILSLKNYFINELKINFKNIEFNGECETCGLYNIINVSFPKNQNTEMLVENLDISGIAVSGGSACNSGAVNVSHVLTSIYPKYNKIPVRFSFSRYNTKAEIDFCIETLNRLLSK